MHPSHHLERRLPEIEVPNAARCLFKERAEVALPTDRLNSRQRLRHLAGRKNLACQELLRSESENNSSRWLRCVCPAVSLEALEAEIGIFVNVAPVFSE